LRTLHFNLSHLETREGLTLHASFQDYPLQVHTPLTRQNAAQNNLLFKHLHAERLTHFITGLDAPPSRPWLIRISAPMVINGQTVSHIIGMKIVLPAEGVAGALKMMSQNPEPEDALPHPKLAMMAAKSSGLLQALPMLTSANGLAEYVDHFDTAVALLFQHPSLINLNESEHGKIPSYIIERAITRAIGLDNGLPSILEELGTNWSTEVPVYEENADGSKTHMQDPDSPGTFLYTPELHPRVKAEIEGALKYALTRVQQDNELRGQQWNVQYGIGADAKSAMTVAPGQQLKANVSKWILSNKTPGNGLTVSPNVRIEPSNPEKGTYEGMGLWSDDPKHEKRDPLSKEMLALLLDEKVYLKINTPDIPALAFIPIKLKRMGNDGPYIGSVNQALGPGNIKANFTLNSYKSGLDYTIKCTKLDPNASAELAVLDGDTKRAVKQLEWVNTEGSSWRNYITVNCTNHWLRHLGAYVQFVDMAGNPIMIDSSWPEQLPGFLRPGFQKDSSKKYLDMLGPISTAFGIPVSDESITIRFPVHKDAHTVRLLLGGLGTGEFDAGVCMPGMTMTVALELALPIFMLTAGAAITNSKWVTELMKDKRILFGVIALGLTLTGLDTARTGDSGKPLLRLANAAGPLLLKTGLKTVITSVVASATAAKMIPIVGTAFQVMSACVSLAQLGQTIAAVTQAPFVYQCDIVASMDVEVTLVPDITFKYFPQLAVSYKVQLVYDKSATTLVYNGALSGTVLSDPIKVRFNDAPSGGNVKVYVFFYARNGWQAGQGESPWYAAEGNDGTTLRIRDVEVVNNIVPLTKKSIYSHKAKIAIENEVHVWKESPAPTTTRKTAAPDLAHELRSLSSISLAQRPASLGYSWQATGLNIARDTNPDGPPVNDSLYITQNISILQHPEAGYAATRVGFDYDPGVAYDIATKDNGTGQNFIITRGTDDNYHLRKVKLAFDTGKRQPIPPDFNPRDKESWGRFPAVLHRYVVHPQGYVLGISTNNSKIYKLKLPAKSTPDDQAIFASMASGLGKRDGLIDGPVAIAVGIDGVVLVLEKNNNRIQAFDINCNPVATYFSNNGTKSCFLNLPVKPDVEYLDLSVEGKGYLYVLTEENGGREPNDYVLTIYTPDGQQLVTTSGVAAAKLALGLDRSLYTLNYEWIFGKGRRTEPSVSLWIPPAPEAQF
jgi:hypothetical protein